jgi:putative molybdopterin biosynthesis protein
LKQIVASEGLSMEEANLLSTREVAALLRVHPKHVYRLLRQGLPARRIGGKWLFSREEVLAWGRERGSPAEASKPATPPLLAANGDLAVELLLLRMQARGRPYVGLVQADRALGMRLLREREVLTAGWHGEQAPPEATGLVRIHLVRREVGLVALPGRQPGALEELAGRRLASRPPTAGIRAHLDEALRREGLDPLAVHRGAMLLSSHREVVCAVARGEAELGLATRAWSARVGLAFVSLGWEPYALVLRAADLGEPAVARLCEAAQSRAFREDLGSVEGYDAAGAGEVCFGQAMSDA